MQCEAACSNQKAGAHNEARRERRLAGTWIRVPASADVFLIFTCSFVARLSHAANPAVRSN
eukprot:9775-Heterococcus_DN1.PRE.2